MGRVVSPGLLAVIALLVAPSFALPQTPEAATESAPRTVTATHRPLLTTPLPRNPQLVARLQALLPRDMSVEQAARGFASEEEFVAAVHVSKNLGVAFRDLKTRMVTEEMDLSRAIRTLKPNADVGREVKRAHKQAEHDLEW
ncbi:MAG: hypothetical protein GEV06_22845 [Luteitalea sp.]|nr:hypothetical protein [Luteitalea sp.]